MKLSDLVLALPDAEVQNPCADLQISGIVHDSRQAKPGDVFVAVVGQSADGHNYIAQAVERGAVAIVGQRFDVSIPGNLPYVLVHDSRDSLARMAAAFYGFPARQLRVIGVTGTDGKTTTTTLIHSILTAAGHKAGMITSISAVIGDRSYSTGLHVTTPDALDMQRYLAEMVSSGADYAVLETTSHGLDQARARQCEYDVAVITNITHEHLDYHGTYEAYREAKATLFRSLPSDSFRKPDTLKVSVLNADDSSFAYLDRIPADVKWSYGVDQPADFGATDIVYRPDGTDFVACMPVGKVPVRMSLLGKYNVSNALAAMAACVSQGVSSLALQKGIEAVKGVRGRMERVSLGQDFEVVVDFAHTPNALERTLELAQTLTSGKVIVVFGCAGLRDREKRAMMGRIAGRLADRVVITAEDPRTEDLNFIMAQIAAGCGQVGRRAGVDYWLVPDRAEAIDFAMDLAKTGDIVIMTGKAHEQSMCFGEVEHPWDEFGAVRQALNRRLVARCSEQL